MVNHYCQRVFLWLVLIGSILFITINKTEVRAQTIHRMAQTRITFVLKSRNNQKLNYFINQISDPTNRNYRHYLSPKKFSKHFGQSYQVIQRLTTFLKHQHLKPYVYHGNLVISAYGSKDNINKFLTIEKSPKHLQNKVPKFLFKYILGIMEADKAGNFKTSFFQHEMDYGNGSVNNSFISAGPRKFIQRYNVAPVYRAGQMGQGQTIGIISFADFKPGDAYYYWKSEKIPYKEHRIKIIKTGMHHPSLDQYDETTNDVEQSGSIAPQADINVYMGDTTAQGMINALATAISNNQSDVLTISWGQSENLIQSEIKNHQIPRNYDKIINLLFEQACAQGISTFSSSGDNGAYDSIGENYYPALSVDTPSASPYVTSVGGTTLPYRVSNHVFIDHERAWSNDFLYPIFDRHGLMNSNQSKFVQNYFAGSGGGFSKLNPIPNYQRNIKGTGTYNAIPLWKYKNKTLYRISQPKLINGVSSGRNVPDFASNADPNTGYVAYYSDPLNDKIPGRWVYTGGTSVVAPQFAAVAVLINSKYGIRTGFWNPQIYRFANYNNSPFHPLDDIKNNNNLYYTGQSGTIYNQGTGLGTVNVSRLNDLFNLSN